MWWPFSPPCATDAERPGRKLPWASENLARPGGRWLIGGFFAATIATEPAQATPEQMRAAIRNVVGNAPIRKGRVKLDLPPLVENGNTVSLVVAVDSAMTATDYVKTIHVFNERNPQPYVITVHLGPRAGTARIATRIRLADSQTVTAIAEMSDGSFLVGLCRRGRDARRLRGRNLDGPRR